MRKIITTTFITLDGVMQAPGGPNEDTSSHFAYGGWSFHYWDEMMRKTMDEFLARPFELLLGAHTYDIFASYWPHTKKTEDQYIAEKFNQTTKYCVSHGTKELPWQNSVLISGEVVNKIKVLKEQDKPDMWVHGSSNLIQTLLVNNLIDSMIVWTFPATVGRGKRLFEAGTPAASWKLVDCKTSTTGVVIATYLPAGEIKIGSFAD